MAQANRAVDRRLSLVEKIAILCSGGDCAGMNPAIKRFVEGCFSQGVTPYAVYDGLNGLLEGNLSPLSFADVSGIISRGGTVIRSSRCRKFHQPDARAQAAANLKEHGISALVTLGGNGSFQAMQAMTAEHRIPTACIPATIDNDVPGSDYALGVDTALNVIRNCLDELRDTAASFKRAFVIELMGRECGYLTLVSALISGAEACVIPELEFDQASMVKRLRRQLDEGRTYVFGLACEGVPGATEQLSRMFQEELGMECRSSVLGHLQRGGSPTVRDRLAAAAFISLALEGLLAGEPNFAVLSERGQLQRCPVATLPSSLPAMTPELLALGKRLTQ